jgi:hypothetical protein
MNYLISVGPLLLLFPVLFLATGVLGRGWFLWPDDPLEGQPRR